jgi:hypothetical protein
MLRVSFVYKFRVAKIDITMLKKVEDRLKIGILLLVLLNLSTKKGLISVSDLF